MFQVEYEGLRELVQALRATSLELYGAVVDGLRRGGEVVRKDASNRFREYGAGLGRPDGFIRAADGFKTQVRPNTSTMALVSVGQTLRRTPDLPRRRSNFGALQMRHALVPARDQDMAQVAAVVETEVAGLLHKHGF